MRCKLDLKGKKINPASCLRNFEQHNCGIPLRNPTVFFGPQVFSK
jgi:hypothetical protein